MIWVSWPGGHSLFNCWTVVPRFPASEPGHATDANALPDGPAWRSAVAVNPRSARHFAASGVVTTGVAFGSVRVAIRSQWSPCMCDSTIPSSSGSWVGCSAGSVSRVVNSPLPR